MTSPAPVGLLAFSLKDSGPVFLFLGFGDTCAHTKSVDSIHSAIHVVISNRNILGLLGLGRPMRGSRCKPARNGTTDRTQNCATRPNPPRIELDPRGSGCDFACAPGTPATAAPPRIPLPWIGLWSPQSARRKGVADPLPVPPLHSVTTPLGRSDISLECELLIIARWRLCVSPDISIRSVVTLGRNLCQ